MVGFFFLMAVKTALLPPRNRSSVKMLADGFAFYSLTVFRYTFLSFHSGLIWFSWCPEAVKAVIKRRT